MKARALRVSIVAAALAACSHGPTMTTQERLALYREHAGAPVTSFRLDRATGMQQWTPLGDQALALWSSANRGHLIELRQRCPSMLSAGGVSITNSLGNVTRMDSVVPRTAGGVRNACRIDTIRPLDGRALRDAKREIRDAQLIDRATVPADDGASQP
ncbi:DUF6491 family protein [Lysobacter arvi]|uniref:DUF6491 family protein n=1 Tax=Lysobacter arvi TaxID=3038776 RepID=A0ABU1C9L5_9GAMM|nr:DUF6491 family protein [Lysobacter arvi]MDR0181881.1 DUF6491 family protein [Lysobacter arvi]